MFCSWCSLVSCASNCSFFFFFNDTATTEIYTLSLHDALPIYRRRRACPAGPGGFPGRGQRFVESAAPLVGEVGAFVVDFIRDRKSTRLNSSHVRISYAVFCLKKKKKKPERQTVTTISSSAAHR